MKLHACSAVVVSLACFALIGSAAAQNRACQGTYITVTAPITSVISDALYLDEDAQQSDCPIFLVPFGSTIPTNCREGGRATASGKVGWDDYYFLEDPTDVHCD